MDAAIVRRKRPRWRPVSQVHPPVSEASLSPRAARHRRWHLRHRQARRRAGRTM